MDKKKSLALMMLTSALLVGCAKEKPYDDLNKTDEVTGLNPIERSSAISVSHSKELKKGEVYTNLEGETVISNRDQVIDVAREYIYVPMTLGTPMTVTEADPFYQGQEKLVRLEWSKDGLDVYEVANDARFADNDLNSPPVLTIPGDFVDYRCKEDSYGKCTNVEEENKDLPLLKRKYFKPKLADIKIREVNTLDIFSGHENNSCISLSDTRLAGSEISNGVINIQLEKTYKVSNSFSCVINNFINDNLSFNGFKVKYSYSIVALDKLASKNYKAIDYPVRDHGEYGFFENEKITLDDNFDRRRKKTTHLLNRFNPNRENDELIYHLSDSFNKDQNKMLKAATYEAVDVMNEGLEKAKVPFKIVLKEPSGKNPGDLRNNMIVLIDDPLSNGLLGYGPSVSNPRTGEILQAHTNMYGGVLKSLTRRVWQRAVTLSEERKSQETLAKVNPFINGVKALPNIMSNFEPFMYELTQGVSPNPPAPQPEPAPQEEESEENEGKTESEDSSVAQTNENDETTEVVEETKNTEDTKSLKQKTLARHLSKITEMMHDHAHEHDHDHHIDSHGILASKTAKEHKRHLIKESISQKSDKEALLRALKKEGLSKFDKDQIENELRLRRYAENNAYAEEFFPIGGTTKVIYPELLTIDGGKVLKEDGTFKKWDDLTKYQQDVARSMILKRTYVSTLIHEIGHNLGLRHNFMGSFDKDNFYSEKEAEQMGLDAAPAYTSIMDYNYSKFNNLSVFGKYDIEALKFGYARKITSQQRVETVDEKGVKRVSVVESDHDIEDGKSLAAVDIDLKAKNKSRKFFMFCTDENAQLSSFCNRFDEGTSLQEIAQFRMKAYNDSYKTGNFRNGRHKFSSHDTDVYSFYKKSDLYIIRDMFDEYKRYADYYGKELLAYGCSPQLSQMYKEVCNAIEQRRTFVSSLGDFFMSIIVTPDHICAVAKEGEPNVVVGYLKLQALYERVKGDFHNVDAPSTCYDKAILSQIDKTGRVGNISLNPGEKFVLVGETGKYLNSFRGNYDDYKYSSDLTVRGTWPDKLIAMQLLFEKNWRHHSGNADDSPVSLAEIPAVFNGTGKLASLLAHLTLGSGLQSIIPFKNEMGQQFMLPYAIGTDYIIQPLEARQYWVNDKLGLKMNGEHDLAKTLIKVAKTQDLDSFGRENLALSHTMTNFSSVERLDDVKRSSKGMISYHDGEYHYYAREVNVVARILINNINAFEHISKLTTNPDDFSELEKLTIEANEAKTSADKTEAFIEKYNFQPEYVDSFLNEVIDALKVEYYKNSLRKLNDHIKLPTT